VIEHYEMSQSAPSDLIEKDVLSRPPRWEVWVQQNGRFKAWVSSPEWISKWLVYYTSGLAILNVLEIAGKLAIVVSLVTYVMESGKRREDRHDAAWALIMASHNVGGDGGRQAAIQSLHRDGVSLQGLSLTGATIANLNLPDAHLDDAQFDAAFLSRPSLTGAWLQNANFRKATLIVPDFTNAL